MMKKIILAKKTTPLISTRSEDSSTRLQDGRRCVEGDFWDGAALILLLSSSLLMARDGGSPSSCSECFFWSAMVLGLWL